MAIGERYHSCGVSVIHAVIYYRYQTSGVSVGKMQYIKRLYVITDTYTKKRKTLFFVIAFVHASVFTLSLRNGYLRAFALSLKKNTHCKK